MALVLIVDDEENVRKILSIQLRRMGHETVEAENGRAAVEALKTKSFHCLITDLKMPEMDGLELLEFSRKKYPQIPVIMMTAHGTIDTAVAAMKKGAFDYVTKPFNQTEFLETVERAVKSAEELAKEFQRSRNFLRQDEKIIGTTEEMEKVYSIVERVANNSSNVLITGETGSGKEVIVRLLHDKSLRREKPLVRAYVSACPADQQQAYLFGGNEKPGCLELAEEGSLYIDEISALSLSTQAQLFECLSHGVLPTAQGEKKIQFRLIAASDFNLLAKIEEGFFRKDLFYTLNVVPLYLPPLRERTQDIEPLADHFIRLFSEKFEKKVTHLDEEALFFLIQYAWPGNIRELENCIEYAVNVADGPIIQSAHLPRHLVNEQRPSSPQAPQEQKDWLFSKIERLEKSTIEDALRSSGGDILKASQKLGVPPSLLEEKATSFKISNFH